MYSYSLFFNQQIGSYLTCSSHLCRAVIFRLPNLTLNTFQTQSRATPFVGCFSCSFWNKRWTWGLSIKNKLSKHYFSLCQSEFLTWATDSLPACVYSLQFIIYKTSHQNWIILNSLININRWFSAQKETDEKSEKTKWSTTPLLKPTSRSDLQSPLFS